MRVNWLSFNYRFHDGYGRFSARLIKALRKAGVAVTPHFTGCGLAPQWLQEEWGLAWDCLTISCLPPYLNNPLPKGAGPHWLLTMTEGSTLPEGWLNDIEKTGVERLIMPCEHNAKAFREGGVKLPISVIHGGTDPDEFALITEPRPDRPYTFLTIADRGNRKGWNEVYAAFYTAFGGKTDGVQDVRLIVKYTTHGNEKISAMLAHADLSLDKRVVWMHEDVPNMRDLFKQVDCLALPSRTEGWGMIQREAAMCGLPVITQAHSGLDDGHTHEWALVLEKGQLRQIDDLGKHIAGDWMVADVAEVADKMRYCYTYPSIVEVKGYKSARWLRQHQTWDHSAQKLIALMQEQGVWRGEREFA